MNMKTIKSATDVRNNFFDILDDVKRAGIPYTITRGGEPAAVLMNAEQYEGWIETLDIMSDPETVKRINEGIDDLKNGNTYSYEEVFNMTPQKSMALGERRSKYKTKRKNV